MRRRTIIISIVAVLVVVVLFAFVGPDLFMNKPQQTTKPDLLFGVDIGFGGEEDVYRIADSVMGYANLIILGSLNVTMDTARLARVCDYLYAKGFYFIIYIGFATFNYLPPRGPDPNFFNATQGKWGDKFLGVYVFDEIGGKQLDATEKPVNRTQVPDFVVNYRDYSYVSEDYVATVIGDTAITLEWYVPPYSYYFMSDYGLYWFDYLAGYGTVFTEFVGNQSRQLAVSMCRGAAHTIGMSYGHTSGQDWGAMITWKYEQPPFLEDGNQLYEDMTMAYQNGAKYIIVFDSPYPKNATTPLGILNSDHLDAMKRFWNYAQSNPRNGTYPADTAYVLPRDYGYGMRGSDDTIWGLWSADTLSPIIWNDANNLLASYGPRLDIVYETKMDGQFVNLPYSRLIFWNGTMIQK